uniref:Uncharacterized protein n=1 Tax=Panagrolaimus sp. PS1159 TaxID=55785 RepID=A0AC35G0L9_9BILA
MYNGNVKFLALWEQKISFNDLLFLSKEVQTLNFCESTVFYENGTIVPYEVIVANLPKLQNLHVDHSDASYDFSKTVIELFKIPHFKNLRRFSFQELNDTFDIEKFFAYLKNVNQTRMNLKFFNSISEEYREKLQDIADEILDGNPFRLYVPPFIVFVEQLRQNELYDKCEKYF